MSKVQGIIFDMDGLIFDTESIYCEAQTSMAKKYGLPFDEQDYLKTIGISDQEMHQKFHQEFRHFGESTVQSFIDESDQFVEELFLQGKAKLKPGVLELLTYLEANNIPKVVASSNVRKLIEILLEANNIQDYFSGIVSGEDVAYAKPHPEIVEKALTILGIMPSEALMLEDSLNGIRAAYSAEVPVIMVPDLIAPDEEAKEKVIEIFSSLHEVKKYLEKK